VPVESTRSSATEVVAAEVSPKRPAHSQNRHLHTFCFACALILVFLRFSLLHETFAAITGVNAYVLYLFAPLALVGVLGEGGVQRTIGQPTGLCWLGFVTWMILAVPFSSWRGGSFMHVLSYVRTDFIMLFVAAGLARTWNDCKKLIYTISLAAIVNLGTAHLFVNNASADRLTLQGNGVISNPNDLAAHLLLVLSFVLFVVLRKGTALVLRVFLVIAMATGLFQILRTGSRGALVALALTILFVLVTGSARQKLTVGLATLVILPIAIALLPSSTWNRLTTFSGTTEGPGEAVESGEARQYLLKQSIIYTLQKPFFGVGPGQFSTYEGQSQVSQGFKGYWHETHNSYTQISSECGIPALVFYVAATVATFRLLRRIHKKAKAYRQQEILTATFCITTGLVAYTTAALFVNFAYRFYLPAISGLVIAMWFAVCRERPQQHVAHPFSEQPSLRSREPAGGLHPRGS
jgi:O-antigen ligase